MRTKFAAQNLDRIHLYIYDPPIPNLKNRIFSFLCITISWKR